MKIVITGASEGSKKAIRNFILTEAAPMIQNAEILRQPMLRSIEKLTEVKIGTATAEVE